MEKGHIIILININKILYIILNYKFITYLSSIYYES